MNDWSNNIIHLSSYSGLVNDPNGLIKTKDTYYIFIQNTPLSDKHMNKSWMLYTNKNFVDHVYEGIALTPSNKWDNHGVFSGGAFKDENDNINFYYTGNIKDKDNKRFSNTLLANIGFKNKAVTKQLYLKLV